VRLIRDGHELHVEETVNMAAPQAPVRFPDVRKGEGWWGGPERRPSALIADGDRLKTVKPNLLGKLHRCRTGR